MHDTESVLVQAMSTRHWNPKDADMWTEALEEKYKNGKEFSRQDRDQLLGHVEAITGFKGAAHAKSGSGTAASGTNNNCIVKKA